MPVREKYANVKHRTKGYRLDLPRYMAECDANYIRLCQLIPELKALSEVSAARIGARMQEAVPGSVLVDGSWAFRISAPGGSGSELVVSLQLLEVFPYTATVELSAHYGFGDWHRTPVIGIRVYHDAATAEVVSYQGRRGFEPRYATPNRNMYHQDEKKQINEFLGEWLTICLSAGASMESPEILQASCP